MKKKFLEEHKSVVKKLGCLALAAVIAGTGLVTYHNTTVSDIPELVSFVDPATSQVQEDEVPLAAGTKTTKKVTTKTDTKKTTMKSKSKKTQTTTKKTTKSSTKTKSSSVQKVKTNTKVATTIKTQVKKDSKIKTTQTTVVTTVTTTTTQLPQKQYSKDTASKTSNTTAAKAGTYNIRTYAPLADSRVLSAFEKMGCKLVVNPNVAYSGCFDARTRTITQKNLDSTVYHELGHFVEFVGGTNSVKNAIVSAYNSEKSKYTASNKAYVLQNSSEYFAESFRNYCENPAALKQARPQTYNAIVQALQNVTDGRVNTLMSVYSSVWK